MATSEEFRGRQRAETDGHRQHHMPIVLAPREYWRLGPSLPSDLGQTIVQAALLAPTPAEYTGRDAPTSRVPGRLALHINAVRRRRRARETRCRVWSCRRPIEAWFHRFTQDRHTILRSLEASFEFGWFAGCYGSAERCWYPGCRFPGWGGWVSRSAPEFAGWRVCSC